MADAALNAEALLGAWPVLSSEERIEAWRELPRSEADDFFLALSASDQAQLFRAIPRGERRIWARLLPPDDVADVVQELGEKDAAALLSALDESTRREVLALLAYAEDAAGGLMSPRFARLRPDMTVHEAIVYLRRQARAREKPLETLNYAYVLDVGQRLMGVVGFRDLFSARDTDRIEDVMERDVVTVAESLDQEEVARVFAETHLSVIPVVDTHGAIKGIVTADDIVDVVREEATEDIQKIGGQEALEGRYLEAPIVELVKKRAPWLAVLFVGEMLTASAMGRYEHEIATAVVLALFVPMIISSGGNAGSQASTLIIRAMALGEVSIRDWWRVMRRELLAGLALGAILAVVGFARIAIWQGVFDAYGEHWLRVGAVVSVSLAAVVLWGALSGSMLPFLIRALKLDPASASAPFVATLVDVSGLVIYFNVAQWLLRGSLL